MKTTFICLLIALILATSIVQGLTDPSKIAKDIKKKSKNVINKNACPNYRLLACSPKIKHVIEKCASEQDARECVYQQLADSNCYGCIDKVIPDFIEVEEYEKNTGKKQYNKQYEQEGKDINEVLHQYATCGQKELFQCRAKVQNVTSSCKKQGGNSQDCVYKKLQDDMCRICVCKVSPDMCNQSQKKIEEENQKQKSSQDNIGFLGNVFNTLSTKYQEHQQQQQQNNNNNPLGGLGSMAGAMGLLGQMANGPNLQSIMDLQNLVNNIEQPQQQKQQQQQQQPQFGDLGGMFSLVQGIMQNPEKQSQLLNLLQVDEQKLAGDGDDYDEVQEKLTEKVLSNPELLKTFMKNSNEYDMDELEDFLQQGDDDDEEQYLSEDYSEYSEDSEDEQKGYFIYAELEDIPSESEEEYDEEFCQDPETLELCEWKIMNVLQSCHDLEDTGECLLRLLKGHPCSPCVCDVVPDMCE